MKKPHNPPDLMPPVGPLSWGIETPQAKRLLFVSGQVGADPNGEPVSISRRRSSSPAS